ncbi:MAG TPA: DUF1735 domain-containing protein [Cyclobacteriaceae bacterium]|nr:hypothetical protein [Cyclobacteriaceae bacterium]HMV08341.1 DUF1735 domain-containing protein [Cyclobacteriaceae bacterium]HMV88382.1 DUF1735 domain-containing protein [Cyclobacteriaceae bacterium]HMX02184.1 DUF1735 domain-containing protein [Cyclobacteriaceae bacterium]HMX49840.1 DUF1735 domain-containing protein [Cyclobacteriaceae bacterium]
MKNIIKHTRWPALFFALVAASCGNEPDKIEYRGPAFVFIESGSNLALLENSETALQIPVKISTPQKEDVTVGFEIDADGAVEGIDYNVLTPSPITIEAGEYSAFIEIEVIDNSVFESETRKFDITLTDLSKSSLDKQVLTSVNVEIVNDDCEADIPKISKWVGAVDVEDAGFGSVSGFASTGPGGSCGGVLVLSDADIVQVGEDSRIVIVFTQDSGNPTTGTVEVARDRIFTNDAYAGYQYEGQGTYDEDAREILIDYTLYRPNGTVWFTGTTIITKP